MDRVQMLSVFRRVAELQSFSAAARDLGLSNAAVSKHVALLEAHVRARLLHRTTRTVSLTAVGASYLARCAKILDDLDDLDQEVAEETATLRGTLRVNAPLSFGLLHIAPLIPVMAKRWPELRLDLTLTDQFVDIVEEGSDLLVRVARELPDTSSLVAIKLARVDHVVVGAPAYFKLHGVPKVAADLVAHRCITYGSPVWSFTHGERSVRVTVSGNIHCNNSLAIRDAVVAGCGLSLMPRFYVDELVRARRLRCVLTDHAIAPAHVWALYPPQRHVSAKIRSFIELLRDDLARAPWAAPPR